MLVGSRRRNPEGNHNGPEPYCLCWNKMALMPWKKVCACKCGEELNKREWNWIQPEKPSANYILSEDQKQVTFHPYYSSGTAAARGDIALYRDHHYYWEIKMLTDTYGTDIMIGVGSNKVKVTDSQYKFMSLLGDDLESYGLSYRGTLRHNSRVLSKSPGFCRGTIIGIHVDLWRGTLQFFINRKPQAIIHCGLRRHPVLYPMVCSTAAQSTLKLIYTSSCRASLLVDAARTLAYSVLCNSQNRKQKLCSQLPPGLRHMLREHFWLTLTKAGSILDEEESLKEKSKPTQMDEVLPSQYANGYYTDNVDRDYRIVVWE